MDPVIVDRIGSLMQEMADTGYAAGGNVLIIKGLRFGSKSARIFPHNLHNFGFWMAATVDTPPGK